MEDVETITTHPFGDGLLVEIIGTDEYGDVAIETIEFDINESNDERVTPREPVPSKYEAHVETTLSDEGYSIDEGN